MSQCDRSEAAAATTTTSAGSWVESERTIVPHVCVLRPRLAAALADFLQSQIAACTLSDEKERLKSLFHKNDTD